MPLTIILCTTSQVFFQNIYMWVCLCKTIFSIIQLSTSDIKKEGCWMENVGVFMLLTFPYWIWDSWLNNQVIIFLQWHLTSLVWFHMCFVDLSKAALKFVMQDHVCFVLLLLQLSSGTDKHFFLTDLNSRSQLKEPIDWKRADK